MPLFKIQIEWRYKSTGTFDCPTSDIAIKTAKQFTMPRIPRDKHVEISIAEYYIKEVREVKEASSNARDYSPA